mgnify:FL=1
MSKTSNLRVVQFLLAHTKVGSTIRYLGVGLADTLVGMHNLRKRAVRQNRPGEIGTEPSQVRAAVATTTASLSHRHIQECCNCLREGQFLTVSGNWCIPQRMTALPNADMALLANQTARTLRVTFSIAHLRRVGHYPPVALAWAIVARGPDFAESAFMKVLFTSTQGEGHVRPLLPYARALALLGHEVAFAAPGSSAAILDKAGFVHHNFPGMSEQEFTSFWAPHWAKNVSRDAAMKIAVPEMFVRFRARRALPHLMEIVEHWRPNLIVRESSEFGGLVVADAHDLPHVRVNVHNCDVEARNIDFGANALDELRAEAGIAPDGGAGLWAEPVFTAFPFGFDGDARHGSGNPPFRVNGGSSGPPPASDWSHKGDLPLVYVTFGTMVSVRPGRDSIFRVALDAVAELDIEVLMTTGPGVETSSLGAIPNNAVVRAFVPQAAVFPFASAMLCHGGSGTLLGGFAAGLPQVVTPQGADQPYNADRTESGGFGLHADASSPSDVRAALSRVLSSADFAEAASRLGDEIQAMHDHGVAAAKIAAYA